MSFQLPPGLAQPSSVADPQDLTDLAWQQPALHPHALQLPAVHHSVAQQPATAKTALIAPVIEPPLRTKPSEAQASHQPSKSRRKHQPSTDLIANKLQCILDRASTFQEKELAVQPSEEELPDVQAAMKNAHLHAYFNEDLSLFSAEEIKKAKQIASDSLRGTYDHVSRASLSPQQLQQVMIFKRGKSQLARKTCRYKLPEADLRA